MRLDDEGRCTGSRTPTYAGAHGQTRSADIWPSRISLRIEAVRSGIAERAEREKRSFIGVSRGRTGRHLTFDDHDARPPILSAAEVQNVGSRARAELPSSAARASTPVMQCHKYIFIEFAHPNTVRHDYRYDLADSRRSRGSFLASLRPAATRLSISPRAARISFHGGLTRPTTFLRLGLAATGSTYNFNAVYTQSKREYHLY